MQLVPVAHRIGENGRLLDPIDDDWLLESVTDDGARISNSRTGHFTTLGFDHIYEFTSNPDRSRGDARYGFLTLKVQIHLRGNSLWIMPTPRPGEPRPYASPAPELDLIAIGPGIVCSGVLSEIDGTEWSIHVESFVSGDFNALVAFSEGFHGRTLSERYILANEIGDGRVIRGPPSVKKIGPDYIVRCQVERFPRIRAQQLGSEMAISPTTNDVFIKNGQIARVSGLEALPQRVQLCLSLQRGEWFLHPDVGVRFAEYLNTFRNSTWLEHLLKLEVIRQASIPYHDVILNRQYTPLQCIERVWDVKILSESPSNNRLAMRVEFEVNGVGRWQHDISVFVASGQRTMANLAEAPEKPPTRRPAA